MTGIFKILLFIFVFILAILAGYKVFKFLNRKIADAEKWWDIALYVFALIVINAAIFFASFLALIKLYGLLVSEE